MFSDDQIKLFKSIDEISQPLGTALLAVGGTVRDLFLGHDPTDNDIDFLVAGDALTFAGTFLERSGGTLKKFPSFLTAKILNPTSFPSLREIDFASSRTEIYEKPGKLPHVSPAPLADDLRRRDFTVNAMAIPVPELLNWGNQRFGNLEALAAITIDNFNGRKDLQDRKIRILHDNSFVDDPTRIFRACRYVARIGGMLESNTKNLALSAVQNGALTTISIPRIMNEIKKIFEEACPSIALEELHRLGVFAKLPFFDTARVGEFLRATRTFEKAALREASMARNEIGQRLIFIFSEPQARSATFQRIGWGERQINKLDQEIKLLDQGASLSDAQISKVSVATLYAALFCCDDRDIAWIENAIQKRGTSV